MSRHLLPSFTIGADDLQVLIGLISEFDDQGFLRVQGAGKVPKISVGWASDIAWLDGTSDELQSFQAVCKRVLAGSPVASTPEELEELASVLSVEIEFDSNAKWVVSSGDQRKTADSVLEAARAILTDRDFWSSSQPGDASSVAQVPAQKPPLAVQDPANPTVFHEDGRTFRYERGYRVYL